MSLDTFLTRLGIQRHDPNSLEAQLHAMRRDVQRIGQYLNRQSASMTDEWGERAHDFGRQAAINTAEFAQQASKQALIGAGKVRRDPLPAIALVGTALLLARLMRR